MGRVYVGVRGCERDGLLRILEGAERCEGALIFVVRVKEKHAVRGRPRGAPEHFRVLGILGCELQSQLARRAQLHRAPQVIGLAKLLLQRPPIFAGPHD